MDEEYLEAFKNANEVMDQIFQKLFAYSLEYLKISHKEVAAKFGVSLPTVERWRSGKNAPHPIMRRIVYDWLIEKAKERL